MKALFGAVRAYIAQPDPLAARASLIAMVLGWNTPFYPLYVLPITGMAALPRVLLMLCACPLFLAMPALIRRHARAGRAALVVVGLLNTVFDTWVLGEASGTELFLLPCIALAGLVFRRTERLIMLPLAVLPVLAYWLLDSRYPAVPPAFTGAAAGHLLSLNAISVGCLMVFFALTCPPEQA